MDSNPFSNPSLLSALQDTLKLHSNRVGTAISAPTAGNAMSRPSEFSKRPVVQFFLPPLKIRYRKMTIRAIKETPRIIPGNVPLREYQGNDATQCDDLLGKPALGFKYSSLLARNEQFHQGS